MIITESNWKTNGIINKNKNKIMTNNEDELEDQDEIKKPPITALSTEVQAYQTKEKPKNVEIKKGGIYTLMNGNGTHDVTIVVIRKLGAEVIIYYKYKRDDGKFAVTWINGQCNLETFRAQMIKYGEIESLELIYPEEVQ